jgi:diadenosine tetraphosphate (Ap4A) HIT family hydrolase
MTNTECPFCGSSGGQVLFEDGLCRVVLVGGSEGADFPGFCRVVWRRHVREMSDLSAGEQRHLMDVVLATERAVRAVQQPDKINIASLGNVTPHLHWHVIPRWVDDSHFPAPVWAAPRRHGATRPPVQAAALKHAVENALQKELPK